MIKNRDKKFKKLLSQDSMAYINKYIAQILLLMINAEVYVVYTVGEAIYNFIYGGIYAISESAKRDTKRQKTLEKQEEHISNTVLINILYGTLICTLVFLFRNQIGGLFFDNEKYIQILNIYFIFIIFKSTVIGILRPLYSVGNTEGNIVSIAKINKNRLTYINILLIMLLCLTRIISMTNVAILICILTIYIGTEIHQTYQMYKIVGKIKVKYMKIKEGVKILKGNYHYLLSMMVYDSSIIISTYVGSLFGDIGILISKILHESYKFGTSIHNIYVKYLEEQMYVGIIKKYSIVVKKTTISAIIGTIISMVIYTLQLKFNVEFSSIETATIYSYIFIFIYCMSYCLDYSSDIITRISGNVKQLLIISIIDLIIKIIIVVMLHFINVDIYCALALLPLGGFISYINVFRIIRKNKYVSIYC